MLLATSTLYSVFDEADIFPQVPTTGEVYRIGKKEQGKNRPIKAELGSAIDVDWDVLAILRTVINPKMSILGQTELRKIILHIINW